MRALTVDVGSTSIRAAIVNESGDVSHVTQRPLTVSAPEPGQTELNAEEILRLAFECVESTVAAGGPCEVLGITNQRGSTVVFEAATGRAVGPVLGWQDLRTVIDCLLLQAEGIRLAPNVSATKVRWLVQQSGQPASALKFSTLESWLAYHFTSGRAHITDHSNVGITGLATKSLDWDQHICAALDIDASMLPTIVDVIGDYGPADALPGSPRLHALIGDQQSSLVGQGCATGGAKITFGTGVMFDWLAPGNEPTDLVRHENGTIPIVVTSRDGHVTWGLEGVGLAAGTCIEWLRDDLGLISSAQETDALAASVPDTSGVWFVPALAGLGTPQWDFGARGAFFGLTRGANKAHLVRSVLEGIAHTAADIIAAASLDAHAELTSIRVDGGMSANSFLMQHLADITGLVVHVSAEREATTRGAGLLALVGAGALTLADADATWRPGETLSPVMSPDDRAARREEWQSMVQRAEKTIPGLSGISF